jgi:hypothetical protein
VTAVAVAPRRAIPVKWWAAVGVACIALQLWIYGAWLLSGPTSTAPGPDHLPWYMTIGVLAFNVGMPLGALSILIGKILLPWRRERRLGVEGIFAFALVAVAWQDPIANYTQVTSTYNAHVWNLGSWGAHIPGWMSPNGDRVAEPLGAWVGSYLVAALMLVLLTDRIMKWARRRWPAIGTFGLLSVSFAFNWVVGLFAELFALRLGMYSYGGAIRSLTLFHGHHYQLPLYETTFNAFLIGGFACLFHFRNAAGETVVERGIERVETTPRRRTALRWLALVGAINAIFLVYNVFWIWFSLNQDPWVKDVTDRSYFVHEVCGADADLPCPGPDVPIPHR